MELTDYSITFGHIKGRNKILADAISRLKMLNICDEPWGNPNGQVVNNPLDLCVVAGV